MHEPTPLDKNLYQQRFNQHLSYWKQQINEHKYLQMPASRSAPLKLAAISLFTLVAVLWGQSNISQPAFDYYCLAIVVLDVCVGLLLLRDKRLDKVQLVAVHFRNRLLISPYLYAGFLGIEKQDETQKEKDLGLFSAVLPQFPPINWGGYKIGNIAFYFLPNKGLLLCKDSTVYSKSPLVWSSSLSQLPINLAAKQQFGYFPELEQAGGFYTDDKLDAAALLKQKEHFLLEFIHKYPQELLIIFSEQQLFAFLPAWPTELAHYHESELIPDKRLFAGLQAISRLLADFERF